MIAVRFWDRSFLNLDEAGHQGHVSDRVRGGSMTRMQSSDEPPDWRGDPVGTWKQSMFPAPETTDRHTIGRPGS